MNILSNITEAEYRAMDGISQSELGWILKSPQHYLNRKDERLCKETDAMRFGSALHMAILETEKFKNVYGVLPEFWGMTKEGKPSTQSKDAKEKKAKFLADNPTKIWLDQDDMENLTGMLNSVATNKDIQRLGLLNGGLNEVAATWERRGRKCKGRFDKLFLDHPLHGKTLVELKSAADASKETFAKVVHNMDYDFQCDFYDFPVQVDNYFTIAIESKFPWVSGLYNMKHWLEIGHHKVEKAFDILEDCETRNEFHGYTSGIEDSMPPSWVVGQLQEETI